MKKRKLLCYLFAISIVFVMFPVNSRSMDIDEIKNIIRPICKKYLGKKITYRILGEGILLPVIPKINDNAFSETVYNDKNDKQQIPDEVSWKYDRQFLVDIYAAVRNQHPTKEDFNKWLNILHQGATREGVYRALVLDEFYASLENYVKKGINNESEDFANLILNKFVNLNIDSESFKNMNFYQIKRIVTEKALEVIDELKKNPDDFFSWYAVLSSDLAENYKKIWKDTLRMDDSRERHYAWAKSVPEQHIKSEVIIKIHIIFNRLSLAL